MIVDEERKGQVTNNHEIGGYENDSDDEREIREQDEDQKLVVLSLNAAGTAKVASVGTTASTLIVCGCLHSQSLAKILYGADWEEIGEATSTKTSTKDNSAADLQPKTIMKLFWFNGPNPIYFALPDVEKMKLGSMWYCIEKISIAKLNSSTNLK